MFSENENEDMGLELNLSENLFKECIENYSHFN